MFPVQFSGAWSALSPQLQTILRSIFVDGDDMESLAAKLGSTIAEAGDLYRLAKLGLRPTLGTNPTSEAPTGEQLLLAIRQLPSLVRAVFFESVFPGLSLTQISVALGMPLAVVHALHSLAVEALAARFPSWLD